MAEVDFQDCQFYLREKGGSLTSKKNILFVKRFDKRDNESDEH